jgi:hypothetical protein
MSPSDEEASVRVLAGRLCERINLAIQDGRIVGLLPEEAITALMSSAVRLYSAVVEDADREIPVIDSTISTTEAMVVACALLRAQRLNPFDLALWFSRTPHSGHGAPGA